MNKLRIFALICLIAAGVLLFLQSVFGLIAMLGIGLSTLREVVLVLCLTMAFPIYLSAIISLRTATICLWLFFIAQWVDECLIDSPHFVTPFDWWHGDMLFVAILFVQCTYLALRRCGENKKVGLFNVFPMP
jgi:hypothetical protein